MATMPDINDELGTEQLHQLHRWLQAYDVRVNQLATDIDLRWVGQLMGPVAMEAWQQADTQHRQQSLSAVLAVDTPHLNALWQPANRLALLPKPQLLAALSTRLLQGCAQTLRRCLDAPLLDRIANLVGPHTIRYFQNNAGLHAEGSLELFARGDEPDWAMAGYQLMSGYHSWTDPNLERLVQLSLPPGEDMHGLHPAEDDTPFFDLLPTLFPETSWLFG